ncbi:hypothetical protein DQC13_25355 [Salmonella enterica subsp. enterica serovar Gatow]|nr:hypothetical protein [Salmonella enterica subsp. enterica serovar Gatow]
MNSDSGQMNTDSGYGAKSWYFPPEYAFTQNQNQRSRSTRMTGHARPEYAPTGEQPRFSAHDHIFDGPFMVRKMNHRFKNIRSVNVAVGNAVITGHLVIYDEKIRI